MENKKYHERLFKKVLKNCNNHFGLYCNVCNNEEDGNCSVYNKELEGMDCKLIPCSQCKMECMQHFNCNNGVIGSQLANVKKFVDLGENVSCANCGKYIETSVGMRCMVYGCMCEGDFPCIQCSEGLLQDYVEEEK